MPNSEVKAHHTNEGVKLVGSPEAITEGPNINKY